MKVDSAEPLTLILRVRCTTVKTSDAIKWYGNRSVFVAAFGHFLGII